MGKRRNNFVRHWPIVLLAVALAESAHAPLMLGAMAGTMRNAPINVPGANPHPRPEPGKAAKNDLRIAPTITQQSASEMEKQLKELESPPVDPWSLPWDFNRTLLEPATGSTGAIGLLQPGQPTDPVTFGAPSPGLSSVVGVTPPAGDVIPPLSAPDPYTNDLGGVSNTANQTPVTPVHRHPVVQEVTPVPEPGMSIMMFGAVLVLRRRRPHSLVN